MNRSMRLVFVLLILAGTLAGCGDDGDVSGIGDTEPFPSRSTPEKLLTEYYKFAHDEHDSVRYARMLHEDYEFDCLEESDGLPAGEGEWQSWSRIDELAAIGSLFRDESVAAMTLSAYVQSNDAYLGADCDGCRELEATVTLRITSVIDDPENPVDTLAIDTAQIFVCKPDPSDASRWLLWRRLEVPRGPAGPEGCAFLEFLERYGLP